MAQNNAVQSSASALVISASNKAGMDGIDRERIDAIIMRESENTLYMEQQKRRDEKVNERIKRMQETLQEKIDADPSGNWKPRLEQQLVPEIESILEGRRNRSTACVMDMDMFFMACELLSKPHLKELPCCVGGGMISTSNYKARQFGVRSGMAGWIGDKLVEELSGGTQKLVHVKTNYELYKEKSRIAKTVVRQFDPRCSFHSLDEGFIDLAPYLSFKLSKNWNHEQISQQLMSLFGDKEDENSKTTNQSTGTDEDFEATLMLYSSGDCLAAASEAVALMRTKVCEATGGLTCSAGLAPSFTIAKIASDFNKPNGQKIVGERLEEDVWPFLRPLPTRKIPFIGRVTQKILQAFHIATVQQLYDERALVRFLFKPATAKFLLRASLGGFGGSSDEFCPEEDDQKKTAATNSLNRKGISRERTFRSGDTWSEINIRLEDIARMLAKDMEKECVFARTISLKVKLNTFDVFQRSRTVESGITLQKGDDLIRHAAEMLHELRREHKGKQFSLRLIGVRCSNLLDSTEVASQAANQRCMANFLSSSNAASASGLQSTKGGYGSKKNIAPKLRPPLSPKLGKYNAAAIPAKKEASVAKTAAKRGPSHSQPSNAGQAKRAFDVMSDDPNEAATKTRNENDQTSSEEQCQCASCPICNKQILAGSSEALNLALNKHIDACLNGPVIRQAVQEETQKCDRVKGAPARGKTEKAKKRRLTDFFS